MDHDACWLNVPLRVHLASEFAAGGRTTQGSGESGQVGNAETFCVLPAITTCIATATFAQTLKENKDYGPPNLDKVMVFVDCSVRPWRNALRIRLDAGLRRLCPRFAACATGTRKKKTMMMSVN